MPILFLICAVVPSIDPDFAELERRQAELHRQYAACGLPISWEWPNNKPAAAVPCGRLDEGYGAAWEKLAEENPARVRYGIRGEYWGLKLLDQLGIPRQRQMEIGPDEFRQVLSEHRKRKR